MTTKAVRFYLAFIALLIIAVAFLAIALSQRPAVELCRYSQSNGQLYANDCVTP